MKATTKIVSLTIVVSCILAFWLFPKLNKASDLNYVRVYEDTDAQPKVIVTPLEIMDTSKVKKLRKEDLPEEKKSIKTSDKEERKLIGKKREKKYKKEKIRSDYKLKDIDARMYSRAIQFVPEEISISYIIYSDNTLSIQ